MIYFIVYAGVVQAPIFMIHWRRVIETVRAWSDAFDLFVLTCCHLSDHPSCFKRQAFSQFIEGIPFLSSTAYLRQALDGYFTLKRFLGIHIALRLLVLQASFKCKPNAFAPPIHHNSSTIKLPNAEAGAILTFYWQLLCSSRSLQDTGLYLFDMSHFSRK